MISLNDLLTLEENKVSVNLLQYPMIWMGDTGVGKTDSLLRFLKSISPEGKSPLFLEFEDRYHNIAGIKAVRIKKMSEFISIINLLNNPKSKEVYSCVVIDTLDKYEEMCELYVTSNANAEIIKDVGAFGEGTSRFKASLRNIGKLQNIGFPVHFIAQSIHSTDFTTKQESDGLKLNKNTFSYCREAAFLVGYMYKKKGERYITFESTKELPHLKDTFSLPKEIKVSELKEVWTKTIENNYGDNVTSDITIDKTEVEDNSFNELIELTNKYGQTLVENGYSNEAIAIMKRHLGIDDDGNIKELDTLTPSQSDLVKIIGMDLYSLCEKYSLV